MSPTAFFAEIWTRQGTSARKVKTDEKRIDLYEFLTTEPSADAGTLHPKEMPVILTA